MHGKCPTIQDITSIFQDVTDSEFQEYNIDKVLDLSMGVNDNSRLAEQISRLHRSRTRYITRCSNIAHVSNIGSE